MEDEGGESVVPLNGSLMLDICVFIDVGCHEKVSVPVVETVVFVLFQP